MQDSVAEVLRERSAPTRGVSTSIALSSALHIALFVGLATAASRQALPPERTVINMRLAAPSPRNVVAQQPAAAAAAPKPAPPVPKPEVPKAQPAPVVEPQPSKPPKRTSEGKSLFGRSELEPAKSTTPPASQQAPPVASPDRGTSTAPIPAVGKAGVTSLEGGPFPYSLYIDRMVTLIGNRWFRPDSGGEVLAQVYFVIDRDGSVRDVKIEKSSGVASFDRAAYRAVLESSPLPPLPAAYSGSFLGVHLTFH